MRPYCLLLVPALISFTLSAPLPAMAQTTLDILSAPKTLVDRAIEARKTEDIVKDNKIVLKVNKVMAELGTIKASTEIYEQKLLVTGIFDDRKTYDQFRAGVENVDGVKELLWHAHYLSEKEQGSGKGERVAWDDALVIGTKVRTNLIGTRGVADVNFRTAIDSFGTVFVLGRARSEEELKKALDVVRTTEGVEKVVNYAYVKP